MSEAATPLMRQYEALKAAHPQALLFFRVGDFYELFGKDAVEAAPLLNIALTSRDKQKEHAVPLCGVPHHSVSGYLAKLLAAGKTVALAEQMEEPTPGTLVRREVVRVLTPGTVLDDDLLPAREHLYLAAVYTESDSAATARIDLSTGDFEMGRAHGPSAARLAADDLALAEPREILALPEWHPPSSLHGTVRHGSTETFALAEADCALAERFGDEVGKAMSEAERRCAGALLRYLDHTLKGRRAALRAPVRYAMSDGVALDDAAQRTLELTRGAGGSRHGSLLWAIDETLTPMGGRLLRERLLRPLQSRRALDGRRQELGAFLDDPATRAAVRDALYSIQDLERAAARIVMSACGPRDLALLARSIEAGDRVAKILTASANAALVEMGRGWEDFGGLLDLLTRALEPSPPPTTRDGGVIRDGFDADLDALRAIRRDGKGWIAQLEARERTRTGIDSLKIRHNHVFGYYIEITKANTSRVPPEYHRRQTLVNAERYVTPELADLEAKVLRADEKIRALEAHLLETVRQAAAHEIERLQAYARRIARLDVASALAESAHRHRWVAPTLTDTAELHIREGRHPVVERLLPAQRFIPNDTDLDGANTRVLLLTGPNMAGKSTYMRQVALIVIMAQIGSYVPAAEAVIGLVDAVLTRVGAHDDIAGGRSTFMVEMSETAAILARATSKSLILLDEIGRGTSTFDGLSIAWAVAEDVHTRIGARTLFATHYHELTDLAESLPGLRNYRAAVREWNDEIVFLRKMVEGGADRSYGIQVARLAGLPEGVVRRAMELLAGLERDGARRHRAADPQPDLFTPPLHPVLDELGGLDVSAITPIEALNALDRLQKRLRST